MRKIRLFSDKFQHWHTMDKDRERHDAIRRRLLDAESAAKQDEATRQRHLQLLQELGQPKGVPVGVSGERLRQLFEEVRARGDHDLLRNWQLWLSDLILARRVILVRSHLLVEWLLGGDDREKLAEELNLLLSLLKTLPKEQLPAYWPQLAILPHSKDVQAALLLIRCQEAVLADLEQPEETDNPCQKAAESLIHCHFEGCWLETKEQEQLPLIVAHSLKLLQQLVTRQPEYAAQHVPELIGIVQCYMQYGGEGEAPGKLQRPRKVQPAQQSAAYGHEEEPLGSEQLNAAGGSKSRSGGRKNKVRKMRSLAKQRNQSNNNSNNANESHLAESAPRDRLLLMGNLDYGCLTGDSGENCPPSDSDQLPGPKQLRQLQAKVRISALQLLGSLTKQLPRRTLYGYWHVLFPSADSGGSGGHLLLVGQTDGNSRCRALALQVAAHLLYGSKVYLSQACSRGPSNYTPFAVSLASSVLAAYRSLCSILEREYAPPVLTQCLKCLAVLVQATPFEQLEMGFVYEFVGHVKKLIKSADSPVAVSALLVMEMLVATPKLTPEMASAIGLTLSQRDLKLEELQSSQPDFLELCDSDTELELEEETEQQEQEPAQERTLNAGRLVAQPIPRNSWLLRQVLRQLESLGTGPPMRVECYQVLLAMATHVGLLRGHQARLSRVLLAGLSDTTADVRLYAARCLDSVGYQLGRLVPEPLEREMQLSFWLSLLPGIYGAYFNDAAGPSLKCALGDALSNMGSFSFEKLPPGQRNALLAFLSGCASDDGEEPLVRAAALRALAVYVLHPTLKADLVFVENAAELTLRIISDVQLAVRIKAAWALGNISDALIAAIPNHSERISEELLGRLIQAATHSCGDHDKVKANAVRSLGNLLRILQQQETAGNTELMQVAMTKLLDCVRAAGSAKVKWNACHAIGNLVKHRAFFASNYLAGILFPALSQLIVQHANFKVRINATGVLLQVELRQDFGAHFPIVWRSLLDALERSNALDNFEEYNHRDALQQQLCLAIAHLLTLAKALDLVAMREALEEDRLEEVQGTWRRVAFRTVPEQSAPLFTCSPLLEQRLQADATGQQQQRSALAFIVSTLRLEP